METEQRHAESAPVPEWKATVDEIWAMIRESDRWMQESAREFDRRMQETDRRTQETDRRMQESAREFDRQMQERAREFDQRTKETNRRIGELTNRFGEIVEYMVVPNLVAKFRELGFEFTKAGPHVEIADSKLEIFLEVDAFLENGDKVMIVEIKSKPNNGDIEEHIERMEKLRKYVDLRGDKRQYLGAIAGVVFSQSVRIYALKHGFYVVEPSGDTFNITEPTGEYHPRIW